jgi:hypothetical protein
MDQIYALHKAYQASDSEGWMYWADSTIVSYHKTREGAEQEHGELRAQEISELKLELADSMDKSNHYQWLVNKKIDYIMYNMIYMEEVRVPNGTNNHQYYTVEEIHLKP